MSQDLRTLPATEVVTPADRSGDAPVSEIPLPAKEWAAVVEAGIETIADAIRARHEQQHEAEMYRLGNDRGILLLVGVPLLGLIGFMCYLIANDMLQAASQILYPLISAMLGFVFGYFAAAAKKGRAGK